MTSSVGTGTGSMTSMASSLFGSAKQAFKAMAEATASTDEVHSATETATKPGRRGTVLDQYA